MLDPDFVRAMSLSTIGGDSGMQLMFGGPHLCSSGQRNKSRLMLVTKVPREQRTVIDCDHAYDAVEPTRGDGAIKC